MDKGQFVKQPIEICPALNGGYLVRRAPGPYVPLAVFEAMAFSNYKDLLGWLLEEYPEANRRTEQGPVGND